MVKTHHTEMPEKNPTPCLLRCFAENRRLHALGWDRFKNVAI